MGEVETGAAATGPSGRIGLDDAFALETPADNVELYRRWAATYESDFMSDHGYRYHREIAETFAEEAVPSDGPVLDVGCGTGVVGHEIVQLGRWAVDGLDISAEMLELAAEKLNQAGAPAYGTLIQADLTEPLDMATASYGSVVSAGTFTTGHVGPEAIDELVRIVRPGGLLVLGVNTRFWIAADFDGHIERLVADGAIEAPALPEIDVYDRRDHAHGNDRARVIVARRTR